MKKYKIPYYMEVGHTYYIPKKGNLNEFQKVILAKIKANHVIVETDDGDEFYVPVYMLRLKN